MRYAIISDIHGNLPALELVLKDAQFNNVDSYIFVGDYLLSNPYPNECINRIRSIENKYIIRGNEESYLENLIDKDQTFWTDGQMQISYYCFQAVSKENLNYVLNLSHELKLNYQDIPINIAHSSVTFLDDCIQKEWNSSNIAVKLRNKEITSETLCNEIRNSLNNDNNFLRVIENMNSGVYIFGHSHIQWNWHSKDGRITLINPGSCGLPLDGRKNTIPYTILEIKEAGQVFVEEKRLPYAMDKYIPTLRNSDQFKKANVWTKIIEKELSTGLEHLYFFLRYVEDYANQIGDLRRPFAVDTWEKAYSLWEEEFHNNRLRSI